MSIMQRIVNTIGSSSNKTLTVDQIIEQTGLSSASVQQTLNILSTNGYVYVANDTVNLTVTGMEQVQDKPVKAVQHTGQRGRQADPTSKRARAEVLLAANSHLRHSEKVRLLVEQADCTEKGAGTYIYNYNKKMKAANSAT